MEKDNDAEGSGEDENDRVESDPQNTYLQVRFVLTSPHLIKEILI